MRSVILAEAGTKDNQTDIRGKPLLLLVGITLIWGLNLIVIKVRLREFPPLTFTALRFALLALILTPFLRIHRGEMSPLAIAATMIGGLPFALSFIGIAMLDSTTSVAIAGQLGVPFTSLLSIALLDEVVRWRRWTGIILSFAGVMIVGIDPRLAGQWQGLTFIIAAAFVSSLGLIAVKKLCGFRPLELQAWTGLIGAALVGLFSGLFEHPTLHTITTASPTAWAALAFTVFAASLMAHTSAISFDC